MVIVSSEGALSAGLIVDAVFDELGREFGDIRLRPGRSSALFYNFGARSSIPSVFLLASDGSLLLLVGIKLEGSVSQSG